MIASDGIEVMLEEELQDVNQLNTKGFDEHTATGQRSVRMTDVGSGNITLEDNNLLHRLADLDRMRYLLDGKPVPENRNDLSVRLDAHICKQHASVYEDEYVEIRYFQKGTGYIIFKRSDLIDKMNGIVARHFPATLPPRTLTKIRVTRINANGPRVQMRVQK